MLTVAAIQCSFSEDMQENIDKVSHYVREAAGRGAHIVLPPELFQGHYFCRVETDEYFETAHPALQHPCTVAMQALAAELGVAIPTSIYERDGQRYFNSLVMVGPDGAPMGLYRKSHIPDGPGYEEKFYFRPGDTGFKVWELPQGTVGVGICWDQWYPECARAMLLMGADILFYPTAIGSEPEEPDLNTKDLWQRAMIGHAVSNVAPVIAANRIGNECGQTFYGHSFIADHRGNKVQEMDATTEGIIVHSFDLATVRKNRASFGFFRDRRPDLYKILTEK